MELCDDKFAVAKTADLQGGVYTTSNTKPITEIHFGEMTVYSQTHFNALQKKMIKVFFGFDVKDLM